MIIKKILPAVSVCMILVIVPHLGFSGKNPKTAPAANNSTVGSEGKIPGFGILKRLPGLWSGPVTSSTPAGNFDMWYVDFRPVSPGQISQYSTLDEKTLNYISFFIVKHEGRLQVAMRTEGVMDNKGCVTYEKIDAAREEEGYYRFSDFQAGDRRAYTEFRFKDDELVMEVYTNRFNKVYPLQLHSRWKAKRWDRAAAADAVSRFKFPQPLMVKDFTGVFTSMPESIYFTFEKDPYKSSSQPYVGKVIVNISVDSKLKIRKHHELLLMLTTASLFDGVKYKKENLTYISKLVYLPAETRSYTITNVHPGKYFLYGYVDVNNDKKYLAGDYMSSAIHTGVRIDAEGAATADMNIDMIIP